MMEKQPGGPAQKISLAKQELKSFFISHLNKIYAANAHLVSNLPHIANDAHFRDFRHAITETVEDVEKQMARMEMIFALLDSNIDPGNFSGLAGLVDDTFKDIKLHAKKHELRDMSILFYLHNGKYGNGILSDPSDSGG